MIDGEQNFNDSLHALKAGLVTGALIHAGLKVDIDVDDDGDYMNLITVQIPDFGPVQISVLP